MTTEAAARKYLAEHIASVYGRPVAVFNPEDRPFHDLPAIYAFSAIVGGGDGVAYSMAADGTVLGSHWCSHEGYVSHDLGVLEGSREDRHETYRKHYPNGYRMEFVAAADIDGHAGLQEAFRLNDTKRTDQPTEVGK